MARRRKSHKRKSCPVSRRRVHVKGSRGRKGHMRSICPKRK